MKRNKGQSWVILGLLLIVAALCLSAWNLWDGYRAEKSAAQAAGVLEGVLDERGETTLSGASGGGTGAAAYGESTPLPDYVLNPQMEMPVETVDGVDYVGVLEIPVLALELPVISRWSYPNLKIAPCRYEGSAYQDNLIVCAHNYNSHFGRLKTLQLGDVLTFTDMDGNVFRYEVVDMETMLPHAVEDMESGDWDLTLFTCTIGGQTRVVVRCERTN